MTFGLMGKAAEDSTNYKEIIDVLAEWGISCYKIVENYYECDGREFIASVAYCKAPIWRMSWFLVRNRFKFVMSEDGLWIWTIPVK